MLKACRFSFYLFDSWEKWAFLTLPHWPLHILSCTQILCSLHSIQQGSLILGFLRDERLDHSLWICDNIITAQPKSARLTLLKWVSFWYKLFHFLDWNLNRLLVYFERSHILVWVSFLEGSLVFWGNSTVVYTLSLLKGRGGSSDLDQRKSWTILWLTKSAFFRSVIQHRWMNERKPTRINL